jgi:V/A-type H+-transporting ATPase subunit F
MHFFCIADEDTVRGFRLAGVAGQTVATSDAAADALVAACAQTDCGILIITQQVAAGIRQKLDAIRLERERPLIVEIPGPSGPLEGRRSLRDVAMQAIGIRVDQESSP